MSERFTNQVSTHTTTRNTKLLVLRHGQTPWNAQGRWQGQKDLELTPIGIHQAQLAAAKLGAFDLVATSNLQRAHHTAQIIVEIIGAQELIVDDRLKETFIGPWEGLTKSEIDAGWPGYLDSGQQPEGFEPHDNVVARMTQAFRDIATKCGDSQALIISHSGAIRTMRRELKVKDIKLDNLGGSWFEITQDGQVKAGQLVSGLAD